MFIYDLAIVENRGAYYQVVGLTKNTFDNLADRDEKYLKLSSSAYKMINDAIALGQTIRLPKTLQTDEVLPGEVDIIPSAADPLEAAKISSIIKARSFVTPEMTKIAGFTMYNFIILNNDLASEGYVITNKNREQKYIEVIETGNAELIGKLEQYLEVRDQIDTAFSMKKRLDEYVTAVNNATTPAAVQTLEDAFLTTFYASA